MNIEIALFWDAFRHLMTDIWLNAVVPAKRWTGNAYWLLYHINPAIAVFVVLVCGAALTKLAIDLAGLIIIPCQIICITLRTGSFLLVWLIRSLRKTRRRLQRISKSLKAKQQKAKGKSQDQASLVLVERDTTSQQQDAQEMMNELFHSMVYALVQQLVESRSVVPTLQTLPATTYQTVEVPVQAASPKKKSSSSNKLSSKAQKHLKSALTQKKLSLVKQDIEDALKAVRQDHPYRKPLLSLLKGGTIKSVKSSIEEVLNQTM